jgi:hypothetical protein
MKILNLMFAVSVIASACGDDHPSSNAPDAAGDAAPTVDAPPAVDAPAANVCSTALDCASDQYCDYARNGCGVVGETGICTARPTTCPDNPVFAATCGCDGKLYGSPCEAYAAGTDLNAAGTCPLADGSFACGYAQCTKMTEYCQYSPSHDTTQPDGYACTALPVCSSQFPNCACLANEPCGAMCKGDAFVGLTLTCP